MSCCQVLSTCEVQLGFPALRVNMEPIFSACMSALISCAAEPVMDPEGVLLIQCSFTSAGSFDLLVYTDASSEVPTEW